jgi:2-alkenal reductase
MLGLIALVLITTACSTQPADTDAIAATVRAQLEADLAATPLATVAPAADTALTTTTTAAPTVLPVRADSSNNQLLESDLALQDALINVYKEADPSVVYIIVPPLGSGSGFVYDNEGHIVTNNHVVAGGTSYEVVFADGTRTEAELVGTDVDSDLAVLKVPELPDRVEPLPLAAADLQVGQFVVAIGNPFGEQGSMSLGIVSALGRSLRSQRNLGTGSSYSLPQVIQTDAPINPGNSGGPLLNLDGAVVGVNSAIASTTGTNSGVGYSIPVQAVRQVVPSLISTGSYDYPYMGAGFDDELSLGDLETYGLSRTQGIYVLDVTPGGPADQAGLIAADATTGRGGDLVIAIDGQPVTTFNDMNSYLIFHTTVGQTVQLTIVRGEEEMTLPLTLAERP